jgi:hypothetical protein
VTYYWVSAGLVVAGVVVLVLVALRLRRALRHFTALGNATREVLRSELGMLRARRAALAVAARRRVGARAEHAADDAAAVRDTTAADRRLVADRHMP